MIWKRLFFGSNLGGVHGIFIQGNICQPCPPAWVPALLCNMLFVVLCAKLVIFVIMIWLLACNLWVSGLSVVSFCSWYQCCLGLHSGPNSICCRCDNSPTAMDKHCVCNLARPARFKLWFCSYSVAQVLMISQTMAEMVHSIAHLCIVSASMHDMFTNVSSLDNDPANTQPFSSSSPT